MEDAPKPRGGDRVERLREGLTAAPGDRASEKASGKGGHKGGDNDGSTSPRSPTVAPIFAWPTLTHGRMQLALLVLALIVRFYRLDKPPGVVFDEHHFGRFTNQYNAGTYFFDIHPPLGKLVLYVVSRAVAYVHSVCDYTHIDHTYAPECKFVFLRATTAAFSAVLVPVMYRIALCFGAGMPGATLVALLTLTDGLNSTEGRLILIDAQVVFSCAIALLVGQMWWQRWNAHWSAVEDAEKAGVPANPSTDARLLTFASRCVWNAFAGIAYANAISVKFTGLASPGMVAVESFFAFFFLKHAIPFVDLLAVAGVVLPVFAFYWWVHFGLLPYTGDGDQFMPYEFQRTIINSTYYDPAAIRPGFWETMFKLQVDMVVSSNNIAERHNWESYWWEWPVNLRGLAYYSVDRGHTYTEAVYLLGNPIVIWLVLGCLCVSALLMAVYARLRTDPALGLDKYGGFFRAQAYCIVVYALNLLPYIGVARSCFNYHYMPALMYGEILAGMLLERLAGERYAPRVAALVATALFASYLFFCPWIYALPLTPEGHARRRWLPRWN